VEVRVDLPGVDPAAVRVLVKGPALLIAGEKASRRGRGDSTFHLVERGFGRFVRTVRLASPCDPGQARARMIDGELCISLPKIAERRGRLMHVPIAGTGAEQ
jgi:HSP20 family protein